jgi:hypothetical protein
MSTLEWMVGIIALLATMAIHARLRDERRKSGLR